MKYKADVGIYSSGHTTHEHKIAEVLFMGVGCAYPVEAIFNEAQFGGNIDLLFTNILYPKEKPLKMKFVHAL